MEDLLPTLAAAAGEPDVVAKLKLGAVTEAEATSCIWTATTRQQLFTGKSDKSVRNFIFYYDETVLTAIRYRQFKITFWEKAGNWEDPLLNLGRPRITNLLTDPFERQTVDLNRQMNEHKAWGLTPIPALSKRHLASFKEFPVRQVGLSANVGKTIRVIQSILKNRERSGPWRRSSDGTPRSMVLSARSLAPPKPPGRVAQEACPSRPTPSASTAGLTMQESTYKPAAGAEASACRMRRTS